jgi:hypothetical protein
VFFLHFEMCLKCSQSQNKICGFSLLVMKETEWFQVFINNFESANPFYKIAKDLWKQKIENTFERKKSTSLALGRFQPNSLSFLPSPKPSPALLPVVFLLSGKQLGGGLAAVDACEEMAATADPLDEGIRPPRCPLSLPSLLSLPGSLPSSSRACLRAPSSAAA